MVFDRITIEELAIIASLIVGFMFSLFFVLLLGMKTNALRELSASMKGTPLLNVWRNDRTRELVTCKMPDMMAETKNYGNYVMDNQAVYIDKKTKLRMANVVPQLGVAIPIEYTKMAESLRQQGIPNADIAKRIYEQAKLEGKELAVPIDTNSAVMFKEYILFAQNAMTPWFLKSSVERRTSEALRGLLKDNIKYLMWGFAVVMVLIGGAVAYTIITNNSAQLPAIVGR